MANTYFDILTAVENYYGAGSDQWLEIARYGMTGDNAYNILRQVPNVNIVTNGNNGVIGWSYGGEVSAFSSAEQTAAEVAQTINSNAQIVKEAELAIPMNATKDAVTGEITATSGATVAATGTTLECVLGHVATALLGAGIGLQLGVWIDGALYNANPDFWDSHNMSELDPMKWKDNIIGDFLLHTSKYDEFMTLVGKNGQTYINEDLYAYYAKYLVINGVFNQEKTVVDNDVPVSDLNNTYSFSGLTGAESLQAISMQYPDLHNLQAYLYSGNAICTFIHATNVSTAAGDLKIFAASADPFTLEVAYTYISPPPTISRVAAQPITAKNGETYYYAIYEISGMPFIDTYTPAVNEFTCSNSSGVGMYADLAYILCEGTKHEEHKKEGCNVYEPTPAALTAIDTDTDLDDVLQLLKQLYPEIWDKQANQTIVNEDGTTTEYHYVPVPIPSGGTETQPQSKPQDIPQPTQEPNPDPQQQERVKNSTQPSDPSKPTDTDTGKGITPPVVAPTGTANALYSIYNPTVQKVRDFGAWLWSPNFVDQILKMFNDPMQAIISLHKIYATPHTSGAQNIKVGYLDSGVSANVVDQQYITINCGEVALNETYGNVFDYNSIINLYLPFAGIVPLNVRDCMRGKIGVIYHVDVITGAVLIDVKITRDGGAGGILYQYTGNCAEQYPLSSGSYMGIVTGLLGLAGGIAGTIATGGAAMPMLLGAGASAASMHADIKRANGFSGNAGAMGCKKPYLIVEKPITARTNGDAKMVGYPSNSYVTVNTTSGFIKAREIFTDTIETATSEERAEIRGAFKEGVIV